MLDEELSPDVPEAEDEDESGVPPIPLIPLMLSGGEVAAGVSAGLAVESGDAGWACSDCASSAGLAAASGDAG